MSITTRGWGSGAITTQGWGNILAVVSQIDPVRFGFSGDLKHLVLQLKFLCLYKQSTADLQAQVGTSGAELDTLESQVAAIESRLRNLEGTHWLAEHIEHLTNGKIDIPTLQNRISGDSTELDTIESLLAQVSVNLRNLQSGIRNELVQRRTS